LDLQQACGSRLPAWQASSDSNPLARLQPAELNDAPRRIGDQLFGRLMATL
jgi:hypothetical protein